MPPSEQWLAGAEKACNDAIENTAGLDLLRVAEVHAHIATAHLLLEIRDLILLSDEEAVADGDSPHQ